VGFGFGFVFAFGFALAFLGEAFFLGSASFFVVMVFLVVRLVVVRPVWALGLPTGLAAVAYVLDRNTTTPERVVPVSESLEAASRPLA
jgi:hypothetical protein